MLFVANNSNQYDKSFFVQNNRELIARIWKTIRHWKLSNFTIIINNNTMLNIRSHIINLLHLLFSKFEQIFWTSSFFSLFSSFSFFSILLRFVNFNYVYVNYSTINTLSTCVIMYFFLSSIFCNFFFRIELIYFFYIWIDILILVNFF